jgi:lysophospholipid acyltransferase (LPLAT)-like uncharacterized protein
MMAAGWYAARKNSAALVSPSKDGDYLRHILARWQYTVIRGSSTKKGMEALRECIDLVRAGKVSRIVITPDGSRGPREVFKRGAFLAAKELHIPLIFLHIEYEHKYIFKKSWDRFEFPLPFTTVSIRAEVISTDDFPETKEAQEQYLAELSGDFQR